MACTPVVQIFNITVDRVTPEQRRQAKVVSLGILYGIGAAEAAKKLGVDLADAARTKSLFLQRYPAVGRFMDSVKRFAAAHGYIVTMAARRRLIDATSSDEGKRLQVCE